MQRAFSSATIAVQGIRAAHGDLAANLTPFQHLGFLYMLLFSVWGRPGRRYGARYTRQGNCCFAFTYSRAGNCEMIKAKIYKLHKAAALILCIPLLALSLQNSLPKELCLLPLSAPQRTHRSKKKDFRVHMCRPLFPKINSDGSMSARRFSRNTPAQPS